MKLAFDEPQTAYTSLPQSAREWTESVMTIRARGTYRPIRPGIPRR